MIPVEYVIAGLLVVPLDWGFWVIACINVAELRRIDSWTGYMNRYWNIRFLIPRLLVLILCLELAAFMSINAATDNLFNLMPVLTLLAIWISLSIFSCLRLIK